MMPVLPPGTHVIGTGFYSKLDVGDTIIFMHEGREKIKRISQIDNTRLYVLGDHPEASKDSRHFGWIERDTVIGKVFWPHAPKTRAENVNSSEN